MVTIMAEIQTRSEETGIEFFDTLEEAMDHAEKDKTVWKISFSLDGEAVRFVRKIDNKEYVGKYTSAWAYEPI
jgi:hypothetical protein